MVDRFCIFVEKSPVISIEGGNVHIEDTSGNLVFRRVMPISTFIRALGEGQKLIAEWQARQTLDAIPLRGRRRHAASARGRSNQDSSGT